MLCISCDSIIADVAGFVKGFCKFPEKFFLQCRYSVSKPDISGHFPLLFAYNTITAANQTNDLQQGRRDYEQAAVSVKHKKRRNDDEG